MEDKIREPILLHIWLELAPTSFDAGPMSRGSFNPMKTIFKTRPSSREADRPLEHSSSEDVRRNPWCSSYGCCVRLLGEATVGWWTWRSQMEKQTLLIQVLTRKHPATPRSFFCSHKFNLHIDSLSSQLNKGVHFLVLQLFQTVVCFYQGLNDIASVCFQRASRFLNL